MNAVDDVLKVAREKHPDLWGRTDQVARIIDPAAFAGDWIVTDDHAKKVIKAKQEYMKAVAISKAQSILRFLGVNTDADWYEILDSMIGVKR